VSVFLEAAELHSHKLCVFASEHLVSCQCHPRMHTHTHTHTERHTYTHTILADTQKPSQTCHTLTARDPPEWCELTTTRIRRNLSQLPWF
jgi:hypothetical protein